MHSKLFSYFISFARSLIKDYRGTIGKMKQVHVDIPNEVSSGEITYIKTNRDNFYYFLIGFLYFVFYRFLLISLALTRTLGTKKKSTPKNSQCKFTAYNSFCRFFHSFSNFFRLIYESFSMNTLPSK